MQLRLFLAVVPPDEVVVKLVRTVQELKRYNWDVKWVEPHNMHITLKFLGEVDEGLVTQLQQSFARACTGIRSFEVELKGVGSFAKDGKPRVIWAGVSSGARELEQLAVSLDQAAALLGLGSERFTAHLTLGRVRSWTGSLSNAFRREMERLATQEFGRFAVEEVKLIRSQLSRQGPSYSELATFHLS
ncbi:MAG: RNA 2',3'-cyclic phosphodiesterase [Bacillota bacterium]